jgi:hypothetical protein
MFGNVKHRLAHYSIDFFNGFAGEFLCLATYAHCRPALTGTACWACAAFNKTFVHCYTPILPKNMGISFGNSSQTELIA